MPFSFKRPPVRVEPYFGFRTGKRLRLSARVLRGEKPGFAGDGWSGALKRMLGQFLSHEMLGVDVTLTRGDQSWPATSDEEGFVHFDVEVDGPDAMPARTQWETLRIGWSNRLGDQETDVYALAPGSDQDIAVISDIDDTIIETGITGGVGNLVRNSRRIFAQWPDERRMVPGADVLFSALAGEGSSGDKAEATPQARVRPVFYVSSSPWNLFPYLTTFKRLRNLPLGPTFLRDWGFDRATLGSSSHGAHKTDWIAEVLRSYPDKRFVLVGDDTQGDLPAFTDTADRFPQQVAAIILRTTAQDTPAHLAEPLTRLKALGTPLWRGPDIQEAVPFLSDHGLSIGPSLSKPVDA